MVQQCPTSVRSINGIFRLPERAFPKSNTHFVQVSQSDGNSLEHPRLGLVVSKKAAKRANRRNYMKRVIREWFRCHKNQLPPRDFVVRVRVGFDAQSAQQAREQLAELMLPKAK